MVDCIIKLSWGTPVSENVQSWTSEVISSLSEKIIEGYKVLDYRTKTKII